MPFSRLNIDSCYLYQTKALSFLKFLFNIFVYQTKTSQRHRFLFDISLYQTKAIQINRFLFDIEPRHIRKTDGFINPTLLKEDKAAGRNSDCFIFFTYLKHVQMGLG